MLEELTTDELELLLVLAAVAHSAPYPPEPMDDETEAGMREFIRDTRIELRRRRTASVEV